MSEREVAELLKGEQEDGLQTTSLCVEGKREGNAGRKASRYIECVYGSKTYSFFELGICRGNEQSQLDLLMRFTYEIKTYTRTK